MHRADILDTARDLTLGVKAKEHGSGKGTALHDTFQQIADLWSAYLGKGVTRVDVAQMMVLLKMSRALQNAKHSDHYIDAAAYSAIAGELAL